MIMTIFNVIIHLSNESMQDLKTIAFNILMTKCNDQAMSKGPEH